MTQIDRFRPAEDDAPAQDAYIITPGTNNEVVPFRALWVGTTGDIEIFTLGERLVVFKNVPSGFILPVSGKRVNATLTTAQNMVGLV